MQPLTAPTIKSIFQPLSQLGQSSQVFTHVADDVHWTIMGHSPMSRVYNSKSEFIAGTLDVLGKDVLTEPLRMVVRNVVVGEVDEKRQEQDAVVEFRAAEGTMCKNGLPYDMTYAWFMTFNSDHKIIRVRAYLDTDLLTRAINENKGK